VGPILGASKEKNLLVTGSAKMIHIWNLDKMTCVESFDSEYSPDAETSKRLVVLKRGKIVYSSSDNSVALYLFYIYFLPYSNYFMCFERK
jgi:hypothetical protein